MTISVPDGATVTESRASEPEVREKSPQVKAETGRMKTICENKAAAPLIENTTDPESIE